MSLPIHLQSIKSSGVYRFVYDKSVMNNSLAPETLRLLVGYSDKGPFNTPVYITSRDEFIQTYGNISKRLEKKGIYFHRLALQALAAGPILCLNLKSFGDSEELQYVVFNASDIYNLGDTSSATQRVTTVYDTNRFWTVKAEDQVDPASSDKKYIMITTTDTADAACSLIIRKAVPEQYALAIRDYYNSIGEEMPDYLNPIADQPLNEYFADVYVFKGQFTAALCGEGGALAPYFDVTGEEGSETITLKEDYTDAFGEPADALSALANDPNSGYIAGYQGTTIPFFKNANGSYISLDILFNSGYNEHKMLMNMNEELLGDYTVPSGQTALDVLNKYLKTPYIDDNSSSDDDMEDNVVTYYKKLSSTTYSYEEIEQSEIPSGVTPTDVVATPEATAESAEYIHNTTDSKYYKKTSTVTYEYAAESNENPISNKEKKQADKNPYYDSIPEATATSPIVVKKVEVEGDNIQPLYLKGFTYDPSKVNVTDSLGVITGAYGKGLQEALTNRVDVEYHYLVDTYDTEITNNKSTLSALAQKKDNCFAILNFPKAKKFQIQANMPLNTLDWSKAVKSFIMPDAASGDSWCGFFTQIVLSDGTMKTTVPSAGLVSNLFMDKWTSRQPYYIVAGSQYGRLLDGTLVGPDYGFSKTDRDVLEPYGINVIVYEPRRGTYINSEQTAKQIPVSALSKIHIRELVIYLQDEIAELLESYRWELNTQVLRDKIKNKADSILEVVANNGGVYDYLNICDESNNTAETIDNEFLVLDTHIEPSRGAGKMVERLYIYRTGEMRSSLVQG